MKFCKKGKYYPKTTLNNTFEIVKSERHGDKHCKQIKQRYNSNKQRSNLIVKLKIRKQKERIKHTWKK